VSYDASIITSYKKGRDFERGAVLAQWNTRTAPEARAKDALQAIADLPPGAKRKWDDELNADLNLRSAEVNGQETAYRAVEALFDKPPQPQGFDEWFNAHVKEPLGCPSVVWKHHTNCLNDAYNAGHAAAIALLDGMWGTK
jgi:hypothetical protein